MTKRSPPPYLRLVVDRVQSAAKTHIKPTQLAFPYPEATTVLLADTDGMGREEFATLLRDTLPRWIIDIRSVPSFEALAGSRAYAFRLFDAVGATYVDFLGRLESGGANVNAAPQDWADDLIQMLDGAAPTGPYVFLFDTADLLHAAETVVPGAVGTVMGKTPKVSVRMRSFAEA